MDNEHLLIIRSLLNELEGESERHLHTVPAYQDAVRYLRASGVDYRSAEADLVREQ